MSAGIGRFLREGKDFLKTEETEGTQEITLKRGEDKIEVHYALKFVLEIDEFKKIKDYMKNKYGIELTEYFRTNCYCRMAGVGRMIAIIDPNSQNCIEGLKELEDIIGVRYRVKKVLSTLI